MKIKVPKRILVGGHRYSVLFDPSLNESHNQGRANHKMLQIRINPDWPDCYKVAALFHELAHTANFVFGGGEEPMSESQTDSIGEGFCQIMEYLGIELDWSDIPTLEVREIEEADD